MLLFVAIALVVLWVLGVLVFKITFALIHLALFLAAIALIAHFVRGRAKV